MLDDEDKEMIVALENSILMRHLESDKYTKTHWCRYCYSRAGWHEGGISHKNDCPAKIIGNIRIKHKIPNWFGRWVKELEYEND